MTNRSRGFSLFVITLSALVSMITNYNEAFAQSSDTVTYTYDALGRLTSVSETTTATSTSTSYVYDAANNRQRVTVEVSGGGDGGACTLTAEGAYPVAGYVDTPFWASVTLSSGCTNTVVVNYTTRDGTAVSGQGYPPLSGSLTFSQAGTQYIRVWGNPYCAGLYYYLDLSTSYPNVTVNHPSVFVNIDYP
ncbi:Calx-beta domain-containing protein [Sphingomonas sp. BGYR3]|uniref:Calx-beta domain-containing protein n=1 Tax=Sphingomonas sp. BGYR3 TaxID=2975483 RepID=UPI0021A31F67|nr:Calx-beta domain-containing protein [Sphingomonas sp. BGYR3]MDG5488830.1 Calx-beta domain-containing protein [Sphingomonas sp. BGYR3]